MDVIRSIDSDSQFDREVVAAGRPIVVFYYAPWCPHCRALEPTIADLAKQYGSDLPFVRIDVDDHPELADRYNVHGVPVIALFEDGRISRQWVGETVESEYRQVLDEVMARH